MGLINEVEKLLRANATPYIAVDEAKKALFAGAKLRSFHFVVYMQTGRNWLVMCGERTKINKAEMDQWGGIFGEGFAVVYAVRRAAGITFLDAQGNAVAVNAVPAVNPFAGDAAPETPAAKEDARDQVEQAAWAWGVGEGARQLAMWG